MSDDQRVIQAKKATFSDKVDAALGTGGENTKINEDGGVEKNGQPVMVEKPAED